jgi:hypothetical protein
LALTFTTVLDPDVDDRLAGRGMRPFNRYCRTFWEGTVSVVRGIAENFSNVSENFRPNGNSFQDGVNRFTERQTNLQISEKADPHLTGFHPVFDQCEDSGIGTRS